MMTSEAEVDTITISPKFQVVIPKRIREAMALRPGQRLLAVQVGDRIELVPLADAKSQRGSLRGIETDVPREDDRL
ncbi:MAG: AbrB/MazE/SpoVT family DNA-binding domain-containing protein [Trueperaceae bacterium]|nr:AbrB/MazE/SpoVT family DNA-binding domain-containing protein [Trueperaceae bacterium]